MTLVESVDHELAGAGLSQGAVEAISTAKNDPEWLHARRLASWELFQRLPMPSRRDEHWRFTNLRKVKLDDVTAYSPAPEGFAGSVSVADDQVVGETEAAGHVSQVNGDTTAIVNVNLPAGVIFTSLEEAARTHPELVQRHLGTAVKAGDSVNDKFVALNEATWTGGVFLYVPRGVRVEQPLRANLLHAGDGTTLSWRALIVLEESAEATFVEEYGSADNAHAGFSNGVIELIANADSNLHYVTAQNYATPVAHFATHRVIAERDSQVEWAAVGLGASLGKSRMEARLVGANSTVKLTGAYFLDGTQELDYDTQQFHEAPNAMSDLAFKGVLTDRSRSVWRGMIDVAEGAQGTDSYQENRNLILSDGAHADSIPGLQIEANEVRCTHGSTTGKVDEEQLFYLQARGLTRLEATKAIVRGFFVPVLDRITVDSVRDSIREALYARMDRVAEDVAGE